MTFHEEHIEIYVVPVQQSYWAEESYSPLSVPHTKQTDNCTLTANQRQISSLEKGTKIKYCRIVSNEKNIYF